MAFKGSSGLSRPYPRMPGGRLGAAGGTPSGGFPHRREPRKRFPLRSLKRAGQVTVELLLVLPVFMTLLFFIMEMGNLAYQTILVHHCAYELARVGSLVAGPPGGSMSTTSNIGIADMKMREVLTKMFPGSSGQIKMTVESEVTGVDPQPKAAPTPQTHINEDLKVTLTFPAKLVFPFSSYWLADAPRSRRIKNLIVRVRMPIEKPVFQ